MTFTPAARSRSGARPAGSRSKTLGERTLLYIYCRENAAIARAASVLTFEEGEELAKVVARALDDKE